MKLLKNLLISAAMATTLTNAALAMTADEARDLVAPFYSFLGNATSEQAQDSVRDVMHPAWQSFYSNQGSKGLEDTIKAISGFGNLVPDLQWKMVDVKVSGDTIVVRGEATGTPAGEFFGVPHSGNSFKIMSIDLHRVENGKIVESHHIEDWAGAMRQLAK